VTCAVCDKLNGPLILGSDVVDRLHTQMLKEHYASVEVSNTLVADCETDDAVDVRVIADDDVIDDESVDDSDIGQNTDAVMNADANNSQTNDTHTSSVDALIAEQKNDKSLAVCFKLAERGNSGYFVREGILYRTDRILGHVYEQLCLPITRRAQAIKLAHETYGGHLAAKKTKARLKLSFTWPTIAIDVQRVCEVCQVCQKRR